MVLHSVSPALCCCGLDKQHCDQLQDLAPCWELTSLTHLHTLPNRLFVMCVVGMTDNTVRVHDINTVHLMGDDRNEHRGMVPELASEPAV